MPNFDLQVAVAETVKDLLGDTLEHRKATAAAITPDGRVSPQAVAGALPWQAHDGAIEGEVETGSNRLRWHFPQGGIIRQVSFDVRTPPSGGGLEFTLSGGTTTERLSLQAGQTRGVTNMNIVMPAGSWAQVNVLSANGAADLAVALQYESAGSGSTSRPGGGNGGGGGTISVISVNGQTGVVELDADDINDTSTTHKFVTAADLARLANTSGVNTGDQDLSGYALSASLGGLSAKNEVSVPSDIDATGSPTATTYLRGDGSWVTPPNTNTTYAEISEAEITTGTASTLRTISGRRAQAIVNKARDGVALASSLSLVATSGAYGDLSGRPTLGSLAAKNNVSISDIDASGTPNSETYLRGDGSWSTPPSGGGGGAVDSVNGQTGTVVLDADDIDDSSTSHRFATAAQLTKLDGVAAGATANATNAQLRDRSTHTGMQEIGTITSLQTVLDAKNPTLAVYDWDSGSNVSTETENIQVRSGLTATPHPSNPSIARLAVKFGTDAGTVAEGNAVYAKAEVDAIVEASTPIPFTAHSGNSGTTLSTTSTSEFSYRAMTTVSVAAGTYRVSALATIPTQRSVSTGEMWVCMRVGGVESAHRGGGLGPTFLNLAANQLFPMTANMDDQTITVGGSGTVLVEVGIRGGLTAGTTTARLISVHGTLTRIG